MSKANTTDLVRPAVQAAMRAAVQYLQVHNLEAEDRALTDALKAHVKAKIGEAIDDAKAAIDCGMTDVAEQTFIASMVLAGVSAAREVGKPKTVTAVPCMGIK